LLSWKRTLTSRRYDSASLVVSRAPGPAWLEAGPLRQPRSQSDSAPRKSGTPRSAAARGRARTWQAAWPDHRRRPGGRASCLPPRASKSARRSAACTQDHATLRCHRRSQGHSAPCAPLCAEQDHCSGNLQVVTLLDPPRVGRVTHLTRPNPCLLLSPAKTRQPVREAWPLPSINLPAARQQHEAFILPSVPRLPHGSLEHAHPSCKYAE